MARHIVMFDRLATIMEQTHTHTWINIVLSSSILHHPLNRLLYGHGPYMVLEHSCWIGYPLELKASPLKGGMIFVEMDVYLTLKLKGRPWTTYIFINQICFFENPWMNSDFSGECAPWWKSWGKTSYHPGNAKNISIYLGITIVD